MKTMDDSNTHSSIFLMHEPEHEPVNFSFGGPGRKSQKKHELPPIPVATSPTPVQLNQQQQQQHHQHQHQHQHQHHHTLESNTVPLSESSTSTSTSSGFSSVAFSKPDSDIAMPNSNMAVGSKHNSSPTPQTSRRTSGNSITIRITSESDTNFDEESKDFMAADSAEKDPELGHHEYEDRDEAEDTTSNSTSNENVLSSHNPAAASQSHKHKKPKERKQFVRSSIQQQHHLTNQESEDLLDDDQHAHNRANSHMSQHDEDFAAEYQTSPTQNMNSAFDELFAAAETGNSSISAIIEAKMAASAAAHSSGNIVNEFDTEIPFGGCGKKNSIVSRSRNGSFRSRQSNSSVKKASSSRTPPNDDTRLG